MFSSIRPADYSVPYSVLEKNGVAFSAVDKRSNKLLTVLVGAAACHHSAARQQYGCLQLRRSSVSVGLLWDCYGTEKAHAERARAAEL
jgi:hypothetical protein